MSETIRISEIFGPTIQGEGVLIGRPTVFVRTGGCDYRCTWCDTLHAVDSEYRETWKAMSAEEIMSEIKRVSRNKPLLVSLSGGNPAIQPLGKLISLGQKERYSFALETQGSVSQDWFADLDVLILSPKPPSSEMETDWEQLDECIKKTQQHTDIYLKIVIFNEKDYLFAREASARYQNLSVYLQPGNHTPAKEDEGNTKIDLEGINNRMKWLIDRVNRDGWFNVHVLPQLHVMLWGNMKGV